MQSFWIYWAIFYWTHEYLLVVLQCKVCAQIRNGDFNRPTERFMGEAETDGRMTFLRAAFDDARCAVCFGISLSASLRLIRPLRDLPEVVVSGSS